MGRGSWVRIWVLATKLNITKMSRALLSRDLELMERCQSSKERKDREYFHYSLSAWRTASLMSALWGRQKVGHVTINTGHCSTGPHTQTLSGTSSKSTRSFNTRTIKLYHSKNKRVHWIWKVEKITQTSWWSIDCDIARSVPITMEYWIVTLLYIDTGHKYWIVTVPYLNNRH